MQEAEQSAILRQWLSAGWHEIACTFWRPGLPSGYSSQSNCLSIWPKVVGPFPVAWTMPRKGHVTALSVFAIVPPGGSETINSRVSYTNGGIAAVTANLTLGPASQSAYVVWANGLYPFLELDLLYVEFISDTSPSTCSYLEWVVEVTLLC